jgi:VanZ family protein
MSACGPQANSRHHPVFSWISTVLLDRTGVVHAMVKLVFYGGLLLLLVLLFVGGTDDDSTRLVKAVWNSGHLFLFVGLSLALLGINRLKNKTSVQQLLLVTVLGLGLGVGIEYTQRLVGRSFESGDVLFDLSGAWLGLLLFRIHRSQRRIMALLKALPFMLLIIFVVFQPVFTAYRDAIAMKRDFPLLADFESDHELSRWRANDTRLWLQQKQVRHGQSALAINFFPGEYPGFALHELVGDWRGYEYLKFSLYNSQSSSMEIVLKIYDRQHPHNGYKYADRFNRHIMLQPGWNDVTVKLEDIHQAPGSRTMDMTDIVDISLFLVNQKQPASMYFDYLYLSNEGRNVAHGR